MKALFLKFLDDLQGSYWFIPSIMVVAAFLLALFTTAVDQRVGADWMREIDFLYFSHTDGARAVLSTIAGSMIGVAGVTFSMTIVSVSFAGAQFGPRLIGNFMRDRGNQITLGTFIATFVYCLFVLRTVRNAGDGPDAVAYVPQLSLLIALTLTMASVAVLIFFIHHIPESLNVSNLTAKVGRDLIDQIKTLFPEDTGEPAPDFETDFDLLYGAGASAVFSDQNGYIQTYDQDTVMALAEKHDLIVRMEFRPGDFAATGDALMHVWPEGRLDDSLHDNLRDCFAFGKHRTASQNLLFLVDELVEIAARALSPGVNDPFTAMECLNWLGAGLREMADRDAPAAQRSDEEGKLRVIAEPLSFRNLADAIFGQLRQYLAADRNAGLYAMRTIAMATAYIKDVEDRRTLLEHARRIVDEAQEFMPLETGRDEMSERLEVIETLSSDPSQFVQLERNLFWLGGSA